MENSKMSVISSVMKQQKGGQLEIITNKFVHKSKLLALLVGTLLLLLVTTECVSSNPISAPINTVVGATNTDEIGRQSPGSYNNLENLISDFLDDAGDRLKKSRMNGMRQVKQTLRFGRRSDPWFIPTQPPSERMSIEELQSRLLAAA